MVDPGRSLSGPLTEREREILVCLVEGLTNQEIAARLHLALRTVKWYNTQIYDKLSVSNREEAIEQAEALGLLVSADEPEPAVRDNLPAQTTPFIGRQRELVSIASLFADPDIKLVTILAPGGMGKTRLALAAAERQLRRFADGVFFVPLAPLSSPDDIVTAIADNVGFSFFGSETPTKQLLAYLCERHTLLVLDNFEHLLDGTPLVASIMQAAPNVKVLASSREKLNLTGETVFTLSGLHFPDWETPEDALNYDAVNLFMHSAHRVRPDFVLQADDLKYLARICRLTAGMPLALVLAAGWLDVLSLESIAHEIEQGMDILETEQRDVPDRQRSVRATFNYSWDRLAESDRDAFLKVSVFRGGFTAEAARTVAQADARVLRRLTGKALVQALPRNRYEIHELLRQYGEEKLAAAGMSDSVRQAHSAYYMEFMAERDEDIKGRRQQAGLQEIRADFENIRQAWLWAAEHRQYQAFGRALDCLVNFAEMNFSAPEAHAILQQTVTALTPVTGEPPHPVWDQAVVRRERVNFLRDDQINLDPLEVSLERARERGDEYEIAYGLWVLGDYYAYTIGDYNSYQVCFEECLALRQSLGDAFYIAHTLVGIYFSYILRNEIERGLECLRQSARIRRQINDQINRGLSLSALGLHLTSFGAFAEAEALLDEALAIQVEIGRGPVYIIVVCLKGELAFWRGEFALALEYAQAGQDFAGERDYVGFRRRNLALSSWIASVSGDYQRGYDLCRQATLRGVDYHQAEIVQWGLALACCGLGNDEAARQSLRETLHLAQSSLKSSTFQQISLPIASVLAARAGHSERAVELLGLAYAAPKELTGWMAKWQLLTDLQRDLEAELGAEAYAVAWERGQALDLEIVVDGLLKEFGDGE